MTNVKYTAAIGKYTSNPASKPRQAVHLPRQREGVREGLGAAATFALYFAVMLWAIMAMVAR